MQEMEVELKLDLLWTAVDLLYKKSTTNPQQIELEIASTSVSRTPALQTTVCL